MSFYNLLDKKVGPTGYGLMGFTWDANNKIPHDDAIKVMKVAFENNANFWNGGEFYGNPDIEENLKLIGEYFKQHPEDIDKICLSIKGGVNNATWAADGSEENMRRSIDTTLKHLKPAGKKLDLFCIARIDQRLGIEPAVKVVKEYIDKGEIGGLCLSECSADTIKKAMDICKVSAVEVEYSLWSREPEGNGIFRLCSQKNIPVIAYSPLGKGYFTGSFKSGGEVSDMRQHFDRFQGDAIEKNWKLVEMVQKIASKHDAQPGQVALEWIRKKSNSSEEYPVIIPIPGSRNPDRVKDNCKQVNLSSTDMLEINNFLKSFEITGSRYNAQIEGTLYQ